jgi:alkanesulfonate monooxygenase SsuD/methylene tetrahydromethanopterin reductase-like flavin-dependent oxidoreductase (luciferase family)
MNPYRAGFLQFVGVAETREEAMKLYKEPAEYFYGRCLHVDPKWAQPAGYVTEATIRASVNSQIAQAAANFDVAREMEGIVDKGYIIVGSPDEVAEQLRKVCTHLNVGHLMLLLQFGNMNTELTKYNTEMFAKKVLPQITDLFDDQWEDRWWPTGLSREMAATPSPVRYRQEAAE